MIADILTVTLKELREIFTIGDVRGRSKFSLLVLIVIFGVIIPLQSGRDWVTSAANVMVWIWMPFLWVSGVVADLFAGERERHTLEPLLATRLPDRAILFGKLLAALAYGFILTWIIMLAGIVTVNISASGNGLLFYPVEVTLAALVFSVLISGLSASIGVLVSLRASSTRQAQQTMLAGMLLLFLPVMLIRFIPEASLKYLDEVVASLSRLQIALYFALAVIILEMILILIAMRLFQRSKLILD
jgi:ABC-2 type transport system permease protein